MKLTGNKPIAIIQGDTKDYKIQFTNDINDLIEYIIFTSKLLNIEEKMQYNATEKYWVYSFASGVTDVAPSDFYSYDITIYFKDGDITSETGIPLKIIDKQNPVETNPFETAGE